MTTAVLLGTAGQFFSLAEFQQRSQRYVNLEDAVKYNALSTVMINTVANGGGKKFDEYWEKLKDDPSTFRLIGKNCSTRASGAFRYAGILSGGIPGLDTPDSLYRQLKAEGSDRCTSYSGYVGFETSGNGFSIRIQSP